MKPEMKTIREQLKGQKSRYWSEDEVKAFDHGAEVMRSLILEEMSLKDGWVRCNLCKKMCQSDCDCADRSNERECKYCGESFKLKPVMSIHEIGGCLINGEGEYE